MLKNVYRINLVGCPIRIQSFLARVLVVGMLLFYVCAGSKYHMNTMIMLCNIYSVRLCWSIIYMYIYF